MTSPQRFFNSMTGRIFFVLLLGVALSTILTLGLADMKRRHDLDRLQLEGAVERLNDFLVIMQGAPDPVRAQMAVGGPPGLHVAAPDAALGARDATLTALLAARLKSVRTVEAYVADMTVCRPPRRRRMASQWQGDRQFRPGRSNCWIVALQLNDGAAFRLALDTPPRATETRVLDPLVLAGLALTAAVLALFVARMAAAPLARLSRAARDLGEDLHRSPLDEGGPTEVATAAQAFNAMQDRIRGYLAERTHMLAAITHDLQTPMTRLRLRLDKVADDDLRERLLSDLAAMQVLIREGLELARSADSRELAVRLDLDSLIESLVEDAADAGQNATVAQLSGVDVQASPQALRRCLANLIDNALTYGGAAHLSARASGDEVRIEIRDEGPGLPEDKLLSAFDPFVRLETSRSRETGGVGLGLTIARALATNNGGQLSLRNHPDGGLAAELSLPILPRGG